MRLESDTGSTHLAASECLTWVISAFNTSGFFRWVPTPPARGCYSWVFKSGLLSAVLNPRAGGTDRRGTLGQGAQPRGHRRRSGGRLAVEVTGPWLPSRRLTSALWSPTERRRRAHSALCGKRFRGQWLIPAHRAFRGLTVNSAVVASGKIGLGQGQSHLLFTVYPSEHLTSSPNGRIV